MNCNNLTEVIAACTNNTMCDCFISPLPKLTLTTIILLICFGIIFAIIMATLIFRFIYAKTNDCKEESK